MSRHNIRRRIVCRMLHRRKGVDRLPDGQHDDSARMLAGGPPDARASRDDPVDLAVPLTAAPFLIVSFYIAERCLVRQRSDGSRPVGLSGAEDYFRIFMRLGLIVAGKIQVDIRLFIALEPQERLKGNVKSLFLQPSAAFGSGPVRHVAARHTRVGVYVL